MNNIEQKQKRMRKDSCNETDVTDTSTHDGNKEDKCQYNDDDGDLLEMFNDKHRKPSSILHNSVISVPRHLKMKRKWKSVHKIMQKRKVITCY